MTLTEYIREQARVADANSKEWEAGAGWLAGGDAANSAYRNGMWYAYHDVEARVDALESLLEQARQLLVTAANAGEYGTGPEWAKRYADWKEAVRVLGVKD